MARNGPEVDPLVKALITAGSVALAGWYGQWLLSGPPERRQAFVDDLANTFREGRERDRNRERYFRGLRSHNAYFASGPGAALLRREAYVLIGPEAPFPDAVHTRLPAGFREGRFQIESAAARARVELGYDYVDGDGGLTLVQDGRTRWRFGFHATGEDLGAYYDRHDPPLDIESARLAARLLATPGSRFKTLTLVRPEHDEIKRRLWREHLAANPELAADIGEA